MSNLIYLQIDGVESFVWVTEIVHRHHNMYKVSFKSGYENIFYTYVETGKWIEEDMGFTDLAAEMGKEIKTFMRNPIHVPKILTWHKQYIKGKMVCFGFFNFINGCQKFYQIYNVNKKYIYTLVDMENEEWQILGNSSVLSSHVDAEFLEHVTEILPLYSANAR